MRRKSMELAQMRAVVSFAIVAVLGAVVVVSAQEMTTMNVNEQGVFLDGYDVVAYFSEYEATLGSVKYAVDHNGATFYFSNDANRDAFRAAPIKYLPKYGGYCAFAVANGMMGVKPNPRTFKVYNGELLVFFDDLYNGERFNTIVPWSSDERALHAKAEENWRGSSK